MRAVIAIAMVALLSGCATAQAYLPFYEPGPDKIGMAIDAYCKNVSSGVRDSFRAAVNAEAQPHSIRVYCYGDNEPTDEE